MSCRLATAKQFLARYSLSIGVEPNSREAVQAALLTALATEIEEAIHGLVELGPARMLRIGKARGKTQESVDLSIQIFRIMQDDRL